MSILFTYPGQGAQRAGMLHALPPMSAARHTLTEASDTLGRDVLELDSDDALQSSVAVQVAMLVAGVATSRCLVELAGPPDAVAGLSIGAYPAAVVAGVISFADALRLVERRAQLMEAAFPSGYGMTAILGLEQGVLSALVAQVHTPDSPVYIANVNAPTQLVIAGAAEAMDRVAALAQARGARGIKPIATKVPSHCPLLDDPAAALAIQFAAAPIQAPRAHLYSASAARELRDPARIADDLARNMARPVRWHDTIMLARERGVGLSVEMPPGNVLTKLATATFTWDVRCVVASDNRIDTLAVLMNRERQCCL